MQLFSHHLSCLFVLSRHSLLPASLCFSVSLACSVFLSQSMTSPHLPACFIGPGKSLQRCPKQMLEGDVWMCGGVGRGGRGEEGSFTSTPSRSLHTAKHQKCQTHSLSPTPHPHPLLCMFVWLSLHIPYSFLPAPRLQLSMVLTCTKLV